MDCGRKSAPFRLQRPPPLDRSPRIAISLAPGCVRSCTVEKSGWVMVPFGRTTTFTIAAALLGGAVLAACARREEPTIAHGSIKDTVPDLPTQPTSRGGTVQRETARPIGAPEPADRASAPPRAAECDGKSCEETEECKTCKDDLDRLQRARTLAGDMVHSGKFPDAIQTRDPSEDEPSVSESVGEVFFKVSLA